MALAEKEEGHASTISTFVHEENLPPVPLPELNKACEKFLEWSAPLLSAKELSQTKKALEVFKKPGGVGEILHKQLSAYNDQPDVKSWLDEFWRIRYLGRRDPIALNANFFFLFQDTGEGQLDRAARIIATALHYKLQLDQEKIPPVMIRNTPFSMNQVRWLFSATRIPDHGRDSLRSFYSDENHGPSTARHITVFYQGHPFSFEVIKETGQPHSLEDIKQGFSTLLTTEIERPAIGEQVGSLTTLPRAKWADVRANLIAADGSNKDKLDAIETALFSISLDAEEGTEPVKACNHLLHGDSANRWFDKALQFIIFKNGRAGINIEHCGLDGTTIINLVDAISAYDPQTALAEDGAVTQGMPTITQLSFGLTDKLKAEITAAHTTFAANSQNASTKTFDFESFGGSKIKSLKMSPDAFVQLAMQRAHDQSKGLIGATYESIATRHFKDGRTEAMRTITPEVMQFVSCMKDPQSSDALKIEAFRNAANAHVARAKSCQAGQAPEQYLWELLNIYHRDGQKLGIPAKKKGFLGGLFGGKGKPSGQDVLDVFETAGWNKMRNDALSTSSAGSPNIKYFGFGSTGADCIGVGYMVGADSIHAFLCTPAAQTEEMVTFAAAFEAALIELAELLSAEDKAV